MKGSGHIPRILVTGSRGKSSLVRLIHSAIKANGIRAYARITGVSPRQLDPGGTKRIIRTAGAHVQEMKWWLGQVPEEAGAIILENSAIAPDLQGLAARWLKPDIIVLTNTCPDHQEVWGPGRQNAALALLKGIPRNSHVALPSYLLQDRFLARCLDHKGCNFSQAQITHCQDHWQANITLATAVTKNLDLDPKICKKAMLTLEKDPHDFQVRPFEGGILAMAFSVNDIHNTRKIFSSLGWNPRTTRLLYNHRNDRNARLKSFLDWMTKTGWKRIDIIGDKPVFRIPRAGYLPARKPEDLAALIRPGDKIFGCGNVAGLPLAINPQPHTL